jgi:cag pathogenicity island protein 24
MRFRRLTIEELDSLEEDFVQFLAASHITAKEWVSLKESLSEKVEELIDMFSDIVLEKVFSNIEYLQHRTKNTVRVFYCQEDQITMTGLQISDPNKDLTNPDHLAVLSNPNSIEGAVKVFQVNKAYATERPDEVFSMMYKDGCQTAPKGMFDVLVKMYEQTT